MINVAKIIVENSEGLFLTVKERESGQWELPGGKIREDEDRVETSQRELEEETGLESDEFNEVVRVEVESEGPAVNCWIMHTDEYRGRVELSDDELDEYRWVTAEEYREMDWHADAGYAVPALRFLEDYLDEQ